MRALDLIWQYKHIAIPFFVLALAGFMIFQALLGVIWGKRYIFGLGQLWLLNSRAREARRDFINKIDEATKYSKQLKRASKQAGIKQAVPASRSPNGRAYEKAPQWESIRIGEGIMAVEIGRERGWMPDNTSDSDFTGVKFRDRVTSISGIEWKYKEVRLHTGDIIPKSGKRALRIHKFLLGDLYGAHEGIPEPGGVLWRDALHYLNATNAPEMAYMIGMGANKKWKPMLKRAANLLICGAQDQGKSVFMNNIISSIIVRTPPEFVKFKMIDMKAADLLVFEDIPHLMGDIVTDIDGALGVLYEWQEESNRRKGIIRKARNIQRYNELHRDEPLPYWILVIDEWADIVHDEKKKAKEAEKLLVKSAKMGRAQGLYIVLATQYPNADVVSGPVKSQFTARMGFGMATEDDSRIVFGNGKGRGLAGTPEVKGYKGRGVFSYGIDFDIWQTPWINDSDVEWAINVAREGAGLSLVPTQLESDLVRFYIEHGDREEVIFGDEEHEGIAMIISRAQEHFEGIYGKTSVQNAIRDFSRHRKPFELDNMLYGVISGRPARPGRASRSTYLVLLGEATSENVGNYEQCTMTNSGKPPKTGGSAAHIPEKSSNNGGNGHKPESEIDTIEEKKVEIPYPRDWAGVCRYCAHDGDCPGEDYDPETFKCRNWEWNRIAPDVLVSDSSDPGAKVQEKAKLKREKEPI